MKQILAGIIRHLISAGGAAGAVQAFHAGDKLQATISAAVAVGGIVLSVLHKVEGVVLKAVQLGTNIQHRTSNAEHRTEGTASALGCLWVLVLAVAMTGCGTPIPANSISIAAPSGKYLITTPKNVEISKFDARVESNGVFVVKFDKWTSTNDPQVIDKSYAGQAVVIDTMLKGVGKIAGEVAEKAIQGAKTAGVDASDASRPVAARPVPPPSDLPTLPSGMAVR